METRKPIDFDGLFDEKLAEYMRIHAGKYSEKQWESVIPKLYKQFGDLVIPSVGTSPKQYYAAMTDAELVETLRRHIAEDVPVPDFLCRELESRDCPKELVALLSEGDERILTLAVNLAGDNERAFPAYFRILAEEKDGEIKDAVCEQLKSKADAAKPRALEFYREGKERELMLEILSRCKERDDAVFDILMREFRTSENVPMHAGYLAAYGDARALPVLLEWIDRDDINYIEYQELKYAIEALGGEYTRVRDFSEDPYFLEIAEQSRLPSDLDLTKKTDVN